MNQLTSQHPVAHPAASPAQARHPAGHVHRRLSARFVAAGLGLAAIAVGVAWSDAAAAQTTLGVDLSYNDVMDEAGTNGGAGVDIYFGPRLDLAVLALTTELSGGFHDFGGSLEPTVYRGMVGGRLGLGFIIRPSVFAHVGVGHLRYDELIGSGRDGRTNVATDLGLALDFTVLPLVDIGIQASYNSILGGESSTAFEWLQAGAHVTFVLDGA